MSRTYKATGINLKSMVLGESDRLLTILTREFGLVRAVAPGARKHHSKMGGRSALFVVNELLIAKGRSLDKITQAETLTSYPALSQDLLKLSASQYLAELVLCHALSEHPQEELFCLLSEHLERLERLPKTTGERSFAVLAHLAHAVFHLLALAGIAPQLQACCITRSPITPDFQNPDWRVGFSIVSGGTVTLMKGESEGWKDDRLDSRETFPPSPPASSPMPTLSTETLTLNAQLNATELAMLQQLAQPELPPLLQNSIHQLLSPSWLSVERILRQYTQYHFGRSIRSAALIDSYFASLPTAS